MRFVLAVGGVVNEGWVVGGGERGMQEETRAKKRAGECGGGQCEAPENLARQHGALARARDAALKE